MKEDLLRGMIRKQIKSSILEAPEARSAVGTKLGSVEKMAGVKMLKRALGQGTPQQQAAGLLQVVQAISGDNPQVAKQLSVMLRKGGISAPPAEEIPSEPSIPTEAISGTLANRGEKLDKTQAMKMLQTTLAAKPASQQAEFVADLVKKLELKGNVNLLIRKLRKK